MKKTGILTENTLTTLKKLYQGRLSETPGTLGILCMVANGHQGTIDVHCAEQPWTPEQCQVTIIELLDSEISDLEPLQAEFECKEVQVRESEKAILSLPSSELWELQMRYETTLENRIFRATHELERLQAKRLQRNF